MRFVPYRNLRRIGGELPLKNQVAVLRAAMLDYSTSWKKLAEILQHSIDQRDLSYVLSHHTITSRYSNNIFVWVAGTGQLQHLKPTKLVSRGACQAALYPACANGHYEIVRHLLLDSRVSLSERPVVRLINDVAVKGHTNILRLLLADKRLTSLPNEMNTLMEVATNSLCNPINIYRVLLADKRFSMHGSPAGDPLSLAIQQGDHGTVRFLAAHDCVNVTMGNHRPLFTAAMMDDLGIFELLLQQYSKLDLAEVFDEVGFQVCENECYTVMEFLLRDKRFSELVSLHGGRLLRHACLRSGAEMVKLLIVDSRVDVLASQEEILAHVVHNNELDTLRVLLASYRLSFSPSEYIRIIKSARSSKVRQLLLAYEDEFIPFGDLRRKVRKFSVYE